MKLSAFILPILASVAVGIPVGDMVRRVCCLVKRCPSSPIVGTNLDRIKSEVFDECFNKCMAVGKGVIVEPSRVYCAADCKKEGAGGAEVE
jgi:hypothetical protein